MIGLWHRWFDAREHRRAREAAEIQSAATLAELVKVRAQLDERAEKQSVDPVDEADLRARDERIEELARNLANSERATKAALDRAGYTVSDEAVAVARAILREPGEGETR